VADFAGQTRTMRVYYDGHSAPWLGMAAGSKFPKVSLVAYDGIRLRIAYNSPSIRVATIYLNDPSVLYRLGQISRGGLWFQVGGVSEIYTLDKVDVLRQTENSILSSGESYPVGRVGAEIAYTVAAQKLGLTDVVLNDPAQGGADLFTKDGKSVIEARMLSSTTGATQDQLTKVLLPELNSMVGRLNSDFKTYPPADHGYAILSYLDEHGVIKTIVLEVLKSS